MLTFVPNTNKRLCKLLLKTGEIEAFEMGHGLWQARFQPSDHRSISIDGVAFEMLNVGLAYSRIRTRLQSNKTSE